VLLQDFAILHTSVVDGNASGSSVHVSHSVPSLLLIRCRRAMGRHRVIFHAGGFAPHVSSSCVRCLGTCAAGHHSAALHRRSSSSTRRGRRGFPPFPPLLSPLSLSPFSPSPPSFPPVYRFRIAKRGRGTARLSVSRVSVERAVGEFLDEREGDEADHGGAPVGQGLTLAHFSAQRKHLL